MSIVKPFAGIDELVTYIYQGSLEASPWQSFINNLRLRLGCDLAVLSLQPAKPSILEIKVSSVAESINEEDAQKLLAVHACLLRLDSVTNSVRNSGDICKLSEAVSREELENSDCYHQVINRCSVKSPLCMYFAEPSGWECMISVINSANKSGFGKAEKQLFFALKPHLEHAFKLYALLKRNVAEKEIYEDALDRLAIGIVILDRRRKVIEVNQAASKILQRRALISLVGDTIVVAKPTYAMEFSQLLSAAIAHKEEHPSEPFTDVMRLEDPTLGPLGVLIRTAPSSYWHQSESSPAVIIYLDDSSIRKTPELQLVARLFGLTRSEALLTTMLVNGRTLAEAAVELSLTESSARTYLKQIFAKIGVSRQAELVGLVLKSVVLLASTDCAEDLRKGA